MKNEKLKLEDLKITSFVTSLEDGSTKPGNDVLGGEEALSVEEELIPTRQSSNPFNCCM